MSIAKIQKGDKIKVISGGYKGTVGIVTKIYNKIKANGKNSKRASISSVPTIVNYRKSSVQLGEKIPGMMTQVPRKIDLSNLALLIDELQTSRSKVITIESKKTRVYVKNNNKVVKEIQGKSI